MAHAHGTTSVELSWRRRRGNGSDQPEIEMDLKLSGKRALVTGSSAGLGEAIVQLLAAEGVAVVVHGRDADRTHAVAKAIHTAGGRADIALGDLATDAGADAVTVAALAGGPIDRAISWSTTPASTT